MKLNLPIAVAALYLAAAVTAVTGTDNDTPIGPEPLAYPVPRAAPLDPVALDRVIGAPVEDAEGTPIGRISEIVFEAASGAFGSALVARDGANAAPSGSDITALPWSRLALATPDGGPLRFTLLSSQPSSAPRDRLAAEGAPVDPMKSCPEPEPLSATTLQDAPVALAGGRSLGRVAGVVLDLKQGHVAYLLVARVDSDDVRMALPYGALVWSRQEERFTVIADAAEIGRLAPRLTAASWRQGASEPAVAALYGEFGFAPYWERRPGRCW